MKCDKMQKINYIHRSLSIEHFSQYFSFDMRTDRDIRVWEKGVILYGGVFNIDKCTCV